MIAMKKHSGQVFPIMLVALILALAIQISGCGRGRPSENPPIHLNLNMDNQEKYRAQAESRFFADGATMRTPVPGTVARGCLDEDPAFFTGKDGAGKYVSKIPLEMTMQLLQRGQERFNIYCSPCHSRVGDGRGIMVTRGYVPPPSFHVDYLRDTLNGYFFDVIRNGVRNMPSYGHQIRPDDRWAIIAYLRALQRSRNASAEDVPAEMREKIRQAGQ